MMRLVDYDQIGGRQSDDVGSHCSCMQGCYARNLYRFTGTWSVVGQYDAEITTGCMQFARDVFDQLTAVREEEHSVSGLHRLNDDCSGNYRFTGARISHK